MTSDSSLSPQLRCGDRVLDLSKPQVMAVLNITPDSFSDGGSLFDGQLKLDQVLSRAEQALLDGASILDVGGESTRPGAATVSPVQEADRVLPVVAALVERFDCVISVDTSTPGIIRESAKLGAGLINDVRALQREGALAAAAASSLPVCLMHMRGEPQSMQQSPQYDSPLAEVSAFLKERVAACAAVGIDRSKIILDPGFGFGKNLAHNLELFRQLPQLCDLGYPLLVGVSRKSMVGAITGREVGQRMAGSIVLAALAVERGAKIIRVHDVRETVDALAVVSALSAQPVE
ncbi:dihydropteroate synthase [Spongiibacter sp. KMU-158]|uniref:Dihydropteroate synthase n=1 Tax=Spongiibacter pelagi TaxID=2760804 RepID=A0A927GWN5_9GAMM|nr:dihydropteroate synthase [Spongiibacter pelagi]MBD2859308.1 dihydropteroate synthase [Spongiibacter pelagi]